MRGVAPSALRIVPFRPPAVALDPLHFSIVAAFFSCEGAAERYGRTRCGVRLGLEPSPASPMVGGDLMTGQRHETRTFLQTGRNP